MKKNTQTLLWVAGGAALLYYLYNKSQTANAGAMAPQIANQPTCGGGGCLAQNVTNAVSSLLANV